MVYAGQYQPEAAMLISGLEVPSFVAVMGKARTYEPEEGTIYTSVRPEELNTVDGQIRDRWIVETARLTFERIRFVRRALESGLKGPQLTEMLIQSGTCAELADGINRAIEHYPDLNEYLDTLSGKIIDSLRTLLPDNMKTDVTADTLTKVDTGTSTEDIPATETVSVTETVPDNGFTLQRTGNYKAKPEMGNVLLDAGIDITQAGESITLSSDDVVPQEEQPDSKELVYELLGSLDRGGGVPVSELTDQARQTGLNGEHVDDALKELMTDGRCYEPRIGILRRV